ncbi:hypothetical protein AVEN_163028-1 [Araneus ventricosus]|uniref:Uncharacterized protein n=1 Tax=Araneus ventricosus TaxID=182803 RepID=A0A4Y2SLM1_ARAVE|nr:hypothetical protein AVEN_133998-1 [Araneus ventricosus]GBN89226.1 hypothetical protein AVEN_163028-1 [Araneus ventricosus]
MDSPDKVAVTYVLTIQPYQIQHHLDDSTCWNPEHELADQFDKVSANSEPNADIVTDDEEFTYDTCTSIERGHAIFDEKLQEETTGSIEILKENN